MSKYHIKITICQLIIKKICPMQTENSLPSGQRVMPVNLVSGFIRFSVFSVGIGHQW